MGFALSAGHVATWNHNLGLDALVPCQELMTISAGEWYPREKDAKTRQQECGEKKHGFPHPIPISGRYLDLAHKHIEWRLASSVNALGARGEAVPDCSMLSRTRAQGCITLGEKKALANLVIQQSCGNTLPPGSACAMWLFGFVLETWFLWPPFLRFASVSMTAGLTRKQSCELTDRRDVYPYV